jgi:hypothetical protein
MTETLSFTPIRDGYQLTPSYPVIEVALEAGESRKRLSHLGAPHSVTVNWILTTPQEYAAFMGFFEDAIAFGTESFLMELITNTGVPVLHRCRTAGGMPKLTQQRGHAYYTSCTLEVQKNPTFTGRLLYATNTPFFVQLIGSGSNQNRPIFVGDSIQIIGASGLHIDGNTPVNFDGIYEVDSLGGNTIINLVDAETISTSWTTIGTLTPDDWGSAQQVTPVYSTVVRLPT